MNEHKTQNTGENKGTDTPNTPAPQGAGAPHARGGGDRRARRVRRPRVRSEFDNKILGIRRVTRVVAGGRRFSFSVTMVIGNGAGQVGVGIGKASDTALAIEKATRDAKKHLITVPLTDDLSIPHEVRAKYDAAQVLLIPTPGKGFKAGSAVRTVLELAGVKHVTAKILSRSKNHLNNARATVVALKKLKPALKRTDDSAKKKSETKNVSK
ncbi:TPA: 30S ribosomal protein S5 [Patescibacteria group bacterium]|nr:30S ribosomal protein S5 [Patescibacteria group bacterium]